MLSGIDLAFDKVVKHSEGYREILDLYDENEALNVDDFREVGIDVIKKSIESYKQQITDFEKFPESTDIGLFQLDTKELKAILKPSPQRCLTKLEELLP